MYCLSSSQCLRLISFDVCDRYTHKTDKSEDDATANLNNVSVILEAINTFSIAEGSPKLIPSNMGNSRFMANNPLQSDSMRSSLLLAYTLI